MDILQVRLVSESAKDKSTSRLSDELLEKWSEYNFQLDDAIREGDGNKIKNLIREFDSHLKATGIDRQSFTDELKKSNPEGTFIKRLEVIHDFFDLKRNFEHMNLVERVDKCIKVMDSVTEYYQLDPVGVGSQPKNMYDFLAKIRQELELFKDKSNSADADKLFANFREIFKKSFPREDAETQHELCKILFKGDIVMMLRFKLDENKSETDQIQKMLDTLKTAKVEEKEKIKEEIHVKFKEIGIDFKSIKLNPSDHFDIEKLFNGISKFLNHVSSSDTPKRRGPRS